MLRSSQGLIAAVIAAGCIAVTPWRCEEPSMTAPVAVDVPEAPPPAPVFEPQVVLAPDDDAIRSLRTGQADLSEAVANALLTTAKDVRKGWRFRTAERVVAARAVAIADLPTSIPRYTIVYEPQLSLSGPPAPRRLGFGPYVWRAPPSGTKTLLAFDLEDGSEGKRGEASGRVDFYCLSATGWHLGEEVGPLPDVDWGHKMIDRLPDTPKARARVQSWLTAPMPSTVLTSLGAPRPAGTSTGSGTWAQPRSAIEALAIADGVVWVRVVDVRGRGSVRRVTVETTLSHRPEVAGARRVAPGPGVETTLSHRVGVPGARRAVPGAGVETTLSRRPRVPGARRVAPGPSAKTLPRGAVLAVTFDSADARLWRVGGEWHLPLVGARPAVPRLRAVLRGHTFFVPGVAFSLDAGARRARDHLHSDLRARAVAAARHGDLY